MLTVPELWTPRKRRVKAAPAGAPASAATLLLIGGVEPPPGVLPTDFPNLGIWLTGTTGLSNDPGGLNYIKWLDQSGNHNDFNAPTYTPGAFNPQGPFNGSTVNSIAAPAFESSPAMGRQTEFTGPSGFVQVPFTMFAVVKLTTAVAAYERIAGGPYQYGCLICTDPTSSFYATVYASSVNGGVVPATLTSTIAAVVGTPALVTVTYNGSVLGGSGTLTLQVNGVTQASQTAISASSTGYPIVLGYDAGGSGTNWLQGLEPEFAYYYDCKTGTDLSSLNSYFMTKYGIS